MKRLKEYTVVYYSEALKRNATITHTSTSIEKVRNHYKYYGIKVKSVKVKKYL